MSNRPVQKSISFSTLFKYAFRSFSRNRKKNAVLIILITAGLLSYVFLDSFLLGMKLQMKQNIIIYESGTIELVHQKFFDDALSPVEDTVQFSPQLQRALAEKGWKATPVLQFYAELILQEPPFPTDGSLRFGVMAVDFDRDDFLMKELSEYVIDSKDDLSLEELIPLLDEEDGVIMGRWLANQLSARVGYPVTLVTKGKGGFYEQLDLEIVGIIDSPNARVDRENLVMSYANANDYLEVNEYTTVNLTKSTVFVPDNTELPALKAEVEQIMQDNVSPGTVAKDWQEIQIKKYDSILWDTPGGFAYVMLFLIFVIAMAGISNNTIINILSRNKEIGTLQAFGMSVFKIQVMYVLEMFFVGIFAAFFGVVLGIGVMALLVEYGLDYSSFMKETSFGYPSSGEFKGAWDFWVFLKASIVGIVFTVLVESLVMLRLRKRYANIIELLKAQT